MAKMEWLQQEMVKESCVGITIIPVIQEFASLVQMNSN